MGARDLARPAHGRIEERIVTVLTATDWLDGPKRFPGETRLPGAKALIRVAARTELKERGRFDTLDNLTAHKVAGVREAIETVGARLLYRPPYSPDFDPIEQAFAKLKPLLGTAAARTVPDLWGEIRKAFDRFTPVECRNYLAAAGYDDDWDLSYMSGHRSRAFSSEVVAGSREENTINQ